MTAGPWGVPEPSPTTESKMFNAARKTVTVLLESGVDRAFWSIYLHDQCLVRHMGQGGRDAALKILDEKKGPDAVLIALLDADLDRVLGCLAFRDDVIWTDSHDLEATLLSEPVVDKLVRSATGNAAKFREVVASWGGETVHKRLFRHADGMGRLRWLKVVQRGELDELEFKKLKGKELRYFSDYSKATEPNWAPSLMKAIKAVIAFSNANKLKARDLVGECDALGSAPTEQVCNGHDLVGFLHAWLAEVARGRVKDVETLTTHLFLAVERAWLETTEMWKALRTWEADHAGFRILKDG